MPLHLNIKPQIGLYISTLGSLHSCTILTFQYHHSRAFKVYQLSSLPLYRMSLFKLSVKIRTRIDQLRKYFL
jgi:hypothetical protein